MNQDIVEIMKLNKRLIKTRLYPEIKPCPMCGCDKVLCYPNAFYVYIECRNCGLNLKNSSAEILYKRDSCPDKLIGVQTYEPTLLVIRDKDGNDTKYPDHGYVGVSAIDALKAYGHLDRWNRRIK